MGGQNSALCSKKQVSGENSDSTQDSSISVGKSKKANEIGKGHFKILKVIGRGSFGKVFLVKKKGTNQIYAMKVLRKENILKRNQIEHTKSERQILQQVKSPFLMIMHFAFQTDEKLYIVMDFMNGGELFYHLRRE